MAESPVIITSANGVAHMLTASIGVTDSLGATVDKTSPTR